MVVFEPSWWWKYVVLLIKYMVGRISSAHGWFILDFFAKLVFGRTTSSLLIACKFFYHLGEAFTVLLWSIGVTFNRSIEENQYLVSNQIETSHP